MAILWRWQNQRKINGLRTYVLCLHWSPSRDSRNCPPPSRTAGDCSSKVNHQDCVWQANGEGRASGHRGEGRLWWITDSPLRGKCLLLPEVAFPRSVHKKTGNENKITRANMQMKQNQRKTPPHSRRSDGGNPWPPVAGRPAGIADSPAAKEARVRKQIFRGPSPRPALLTLSPNRPPRERSKKKKTPVQTCLGGFGGSGEGKKEGFGDHSCPGKQEEGESLSFQPSARREMPSPLGYVQRPTQEPLAWATEGQPHPAFSSPPPLLGSQPEGERRSGEASREHETSRRPPPQSAPGPRWTREGRSGRDH